MTSYLSWAGVVEKGAGVEGGEWEKHSCVA